MGKAGCLAVRPAHGYAGTGWQGDCVEQPSKAIAALATQTFTAATHWQTTAYMMMIVEQRSSRSLWRSLALAAESIRTSRRPAWSLPVHLLYQP